MLFFVFLILKLTGAVEWSWWWVTSPLWMPLALVVVVIALAAVTGVSVYKIISTMLRRQQLGQAGGTASTSPGAASPTDEVYEAEGTEVTSAPSKGEPRALPPASPHAEGDDQPV